MGIGLSAGRRGYGAWVANETDLPSETPDELRAELVDEAAALRSQLHDLDRDETSLDYDDNFADSGQVAAEHGENLALASGLREQLDDIEAALNRLDQGTYGLCEVCSQPIGDSRLEAMPATRFCIDHAG